ncbi:hypothetical protein CQW23_31942 [Capsicum baccatum]|uniref:Uncharacterized protein n=1 Tax=Capsicum baccatum TaxID=33114 RepID=A0A2G2V649_CAPBA|nr:hypothetical protein CQW23_31942 [Capsicum baccatum]
MDIPKTMKETSSKLLNTFVDFTFEFLDQALLPSQSNFAPGEEIGEAVIVTQIEGKISNDFPEGVYIRNGAKKDENINQLTNDLQECMKELGIVKGILRKVFRERDFMWEEVKSYSEMNMLLNYEINMLKKKVDTLKKDILMKEGQITILKDWIGKPLDLLASPVGVMDAKWPNYNSYFVH